MGQNGSDPHEVGEVKVLHKTDKALCVAGDIITELTGEEELWVPVSCIHDESEIGEDSVKDDEGALVVMRWFARKGGLL